METFKPEAEILPSRSTLDQIADDIDPERSAQKWRDNPPGYGYENVLDATEAEEE